MFQHQAVLKHSAASRAIQQRCTPVGAATKLDCISVTNAIYVHHTSIAHATHQLNDLMIVRIMTTKQGRIHDCPCRGRLGRGSNELGRGRNDMGRGNNNHRILKPELFYLQTTRKRRKSKVGRTDRPTDGRTDGRTDRHGDL